MRRLLATAAAAALLLSVTNAFADTEGFCPADDPECQKSYGYKFKDDPLSALGYGAGGAVLKVRAGPVRRTLIRPRTNFVPEMLKSVEVI
jgi:hypothetical protein